MTTMDVLEATEQLGAAYEPADAGDWDQVRSLAEPVYAAFPNGSLRGDAAYLLGLVALYSAGDKDTDVWNHAKALFTEATHSAGEVNRQHARLRLAEISHHQAAVVDEASDRHPHYEASVRAGDEAMHRQAYDDAEHHYLQLNLLTPDPSRPQIVHLIDRATLGLATRWAYGGNLHKAESFLAELAQRESDHPKLPLAPEVRHGADQLRIWIINQKQADEQVHARAADGHHEPPNGTLDTGVATMLAAGHGAVQAGQWSHALAYFEDVRVSAVASPREKAEASLYAGVAHEHLAVRESSHPYNTPVGDLGEAARLLTAADVAEAAPEIRTAARERLVDLKVRIDHDTRH